MTDNPDLFYGIVTGSVFFLFCVMLYSISRSQRKAEMEKLEFVERLVAAPKSAVKVWVEYQDCYDAIRQEVLKDEPTLFARLEGEPGVRVIATEFGEFFGLAKRMLAAGVEIQNYRYV